MPCAGGARGWDEIGRLAGDPKDYWRREFRKLVDLAAAHDPAKAATQ